MYRGFSRRKSSIVAAGLLLAGLLPAMRATAAERLQWPTVQEQLEKSRVQSGSALERLILENQDFSVLNPKEATDHLRIPLWLRVLYRKNHPNDRFSPNDPTGGYPLVLNEVWEWMSTHQDLRPARAGHDPAPLVGGVHEQALELWVRADDRAAVAR